MLRARLAYMPFLFERQTTYTAALYGITFLLPLGLLAVAALQTAVPIAYLTKDPLAVAELAKGDCCSVYYGLLSNVGILMWCAATAVCLFTLLMCVSTRADPSDALFFAAAGLFTGWLMLDDFFLVHEEVLPAFGIPQPLTYAVYAMLAGLYLALSWKKIVTHKLALFVVALTGLGASVLLDVVLHSESITHILLEDGAKLMGITAWAAFHIDAAYRVLTLQSQDPGAYTNTAASIAPSSARAAVTKTTGR